MAAALPVMAPEVLKKKGNLGENWNQWKQNFKIYLKAACVSSDQQATALFLHTIGQFGRDIFNDLEISDSEPLEEYYNKFDNYCNPKTSLTYNRYQFFNTKQEKNQAFDKFLINLKQKSKTCDFGDLSSSLMMTQIISGINNTNLRERLLRMPDLDLNATIEECRISETAEAQAQKISAATSVKSEKKQTKPQNASAQQNSAPTPAVQAKPAQKKQHKSQKKDKNQHEEPAKKEGQESSAPKQITNCNFCGGAHVYGNCPAFGSTCHKCQKPNHYAKVCKN